MADFINGNFPIPSGCGVGNVPAVATFATTPECPQTGFGFNTFQAPAVAIQQSLPQQVARVTFTPESLARNVIFSCLDAACIAFLADETGLDLVDGFDEGNTNSAANILECFICGGQAVITSVILKTSADIVQVPATVFDFNPCNPCVISDVEFQCFQGCANNFILANVAISSTSGLILTIPADTQFVLEFCNCIVETRSYYGCPTGVPAVAAVPAFCPPCPTVPAPGQFAPANGNGGQILAGQRRF